MFAGIDSNAWKQYRQLYEGITGPNHFSTIRSLDRPLQCFVGYYLVINLITTVHQDMKDPPDGWVAMVVFGDYEGGSLCFPDIGVELLYKSRDVVLFDLGL